MGANSPISTQSIGGLFAFFCAQTGQRVSMRDRVSVVARGSMRDGASAARMVSVAAREYQ